MPRTGSSTAVVTSARSLSSAHDSAASRGRITRSSFTMIGTGSSTTSASGGLRMKRYTPMPRMAGPSASACGSRFMIDCTIWRSDSERVMSCPPAIVSSSRTLGGLDRVVQVGAQVVLELVGDAGELLGEREHEEAGDDGEPDDAPQVVGERDGLVDDAVVDHRTRQPDDGDERDAAEGQHHEQDEQEP